MSHSTLSHQTTTEEPGMPVFNSMDFIISLAKSSFDFGSSKDMNSSIDLVYGLVLSKDNQINSQSIGQKKIPDSAPPVSGYFKAYMEAVVQQVPAGPITACKETSVTTEITKSNDGIDKQSSARTKELTQPHNNKVNQPDHGLVTKPKGRRKTCVIKEVIPTEKDVLLGRGGKSNKHSGNKRYREKVEKLKPYYRSSSKQDKTKTSQSLVDYVHQYGGRFVEYDKASGIWYEIHNIDARTKTSQALRDENTDASRLAKRNKYKKLK